MKQNYIIYLVILFGISCSIQENHVKVSTFSNSSTSINIELPAGAVEYDFDTVSAIADTNYQGYDKTDLGDSYLQVRQDMQGQSEMDYSSKIFLLPTGEIFIFHGPFDLINKSRGKDKNGEKLYESKKEALHRMSLIQFDQNKVIDVRVRKVGGDNFYWSERVSSVDSNNHFIEFSTPSVEPYISKMVRGKFYFKESNRSESIKRIEKILGSVYQAEGK